MRQLVHSIILVIMYFALINHSKSQSFKLEYQLLQSDGKFTEQSLSPGSSLFFYPGTNQVIVETVFENDKTGYAEFVIKKSENDTLEDFLDDGDVFNLYHSETKQAVVLKREDQDDGSIKLILLFLDLNSMIIYTGSQYQMDLDDN
jgi:hypothetical protein